MCPFKEELQPNYHSRFSRQIFVSPQLQPKIPSTYFHTQPNVLISEISGHVQCPVRFGKDLEQYHREHRLQMRLHILCFTILIYFMFIRDYYPDFGDTKFIVTCFLLPSLSISCITQSRDLTTMR